MDGSRSAALLGALAGVALVWVASVRHSGSRAPIAAVEASSASVLQPTAASHPGATLQPPAANHPDAALPPTAANHPDATLPPTATGEPAERGTTTLTATQPRAEPPESRPLSALRRAFELEARDASAAHAEAVIRQLYTGAPDAAGILRAVRCVRTVCKLDARWSPAWNAPYNARLLRLIESFSRELSLEAAGPPDGGVVPIEIYVRRPATP